MFERETNTSKILSSSRMSLASEKDQANKLYRQCGMYFLKLFVRQCN